MRRFFLHLSVGLITFVLGVGALFLVMTASQGQSTEITAISEVNQVPESSIPAVEPEPRASDIEGSTEFVCTDELIKPTWELVLKTAKDNYLRYSKGKIDCAEEFRTPRYLKVNINNSRFREIVIQGKWGEKLCGMYSGCWFGIFEIHGNTYKPLFLNGNVTRFTVKSSATHGYHDLILYSSGGSYGEYSEHYRFDGMSYKKYRCFLTSLDYYDRNGQLRQSKSPVTSEDTCTDDTE